VDTTFFVDGLGRRIRTVESGEQIETLRLCRELSEHAGTEAALIGRAGQLAGFSHHAFTQVRRVERVSGPLGGLAIVSSAVTGIRLSEVLGASERKALAPNPEAILSLLEQITGGLAALHKHASDLSHGTLAPERVVVRPDGHIVLVEHGLSTAVEQLQMGRAQLWSQFRIAAPSGAGATRLDQLTDLMQLGVLALALLLGRPIRRDEYPVRLQELLAQAADAERATTLHTPSRSLRAWILRTLQFESRAAFRTATDAAAALEGLASEEPRLHPSPASVARFLASCAGGFEREQLNQPQEPQVATSAVVERRAPATGGAPHEEREAATTTRRVRPGASRTRTLPSGVREPGHAVMLSIAASPADATVIRQAVDASSSDPEPATGFEPPSDWLARRVGNAARVSLRRVSEIDWSFARRGFRVGIISVGLAGLFGMTYLGARGYFGLPGFMAGRGTLIVESRPAGVDLYVDGLLRGQTPATLELRAGEHTLALRTGKGVTLVPVVVVSGGRQVERVEIRQRRGGARPAAPSAAAPAPRGQ
jgi:hypothetical protein